MTEICRQGEASPSSLRPWIWVQGLILHFDKQYPSALNSVLSVAFRAVLPQAADLLLFLLHQFKKLICTSPLGKTVPYKTLTLNYKLHYTILNGFFLLIGGSVHNLIGSFAYDSGREGYRPSESIYWISGIFQVSMEWESLISISLISDHSCLTCMPPVTGISLVDVL